MTAHSLSDCGSCAGIDRAYSSSVRQRVEDVIDTKLIRESGHGKRITGIIGMLPRIADIHVVVRDDHQAMVVIVDALPFRRAFHLDLTAVAQMAIAGSNTHKIGQIIRSIKTRLAEPIRVEELASMANMSPSSFHQHFKAVTAMSPVQYQKRLRLTEARQILLGEKSVAASAAYRVGYQSVSQFSREYARMFGKPPRKDVEGIRAK